MIRLGLLDYTAQLQETSTSSIKLRFHESSRTSPLKGLSVLLRNTMPIKSRANAGNGEL